MTYPKITLAQMLARSAQRYPRRTALTYFGAKMNYGQLHEQVRRCTAGLQALGVAAEDRVALMLPNCPQFVIAYFGVLQAGGIVTATSTMYTAREAGHQWQDAGIGVLIVDRTLLPVASKALEHLASPVKIIVTRERDYYPAQMTARLRRPKLVKIRPGQQPIVWADLLGFKREPRPVRVRREAVACLQYTGGTTGRSKGAMLSHANLVANAWQAVRALQLSEKEAERTVAALPLFHIYAMTGVMISGVAIGATVIILPRFELKAALNVIRKYRPSMFHGVPTMYVAFNQTPNVKRYHFESLRACMSGGAPLPVEVRERFERLTGGRLVEGYGLTEASPVTHLNPIDGPSKSGSIGPVIPDTEARVMDVETGQREMPIGEEGELVIRGPQVMLGYWNQPKETAQVLRRGWLFTGDIAKRDQDGYYYIVDRKKDMIIAGGFNIFPREVEEVLFEHPQVREAVVIGVPDPYRGETVKAFVVAQPGKVLSEEGVVAFCRERLAAYKVPRQVEFRESLPKSAVGKYLRRELREAEAHKKN